MDARLVSDSWLSCSCGQIYAVQMRYAQKPGTKLA